jgi:hypothetical protein
LNLNLILIRTVRVVRLRWLGGDGQLMSGARVTVVVRWVPGHASVSFTLDRYGHLFPEADLTLRERLEAIYAASGGEL